MAALLVLLPVLALLGVAGLRWRARRPVTRIEQYTGLLAAADAARAAGRTQQAQRRYRRLAERLDGAVLSIPLRRGRGSALVGQGLCTAALGDTQGAFRLYREAFTLTELPVDVLQLLAGGILSGGAADGRADQDLDIVLAALAALPAHLHVVGPVCDHLQRRCLATARGGPGEAAALAQRVLRAVPGLEWAVLARSAALRALDRPAEAEAVLRAAATTGSAELWFRLGTVLARQGRHGDAVQALDEAGRRPPAAPSPWSLDGRLKHEIPLQRGIAHRETGDHRQARADLDAAVGQAPDDPRTHYARGVLAVAEQDDATAGGCFEAALRADPDHAPARFGLGLLAERAADHAGAAAHYRAGLAHRPDWTAGRVRLGAALIAAAEPGQGLQALDGIRTPDAEHHRGLARAATGDLAAAAGHWTALDRTPAVARNLAAARDGLARRALAAGDHARARELWESCRPHRPGGAPWQTLITEATLREGATALLARAADVEATERLLRLAADADPDDPRAPHLLAALALTRGDPATAVELLQPQAARRALTPRGRYHLALARLLLGRPALAISLLAGEPSPAGPSVGADVAPEVAPDAAPDDPAQAVLRGALAARAGRWAVAAARYAQSLDIDIDLGTLPEPFPAPLTCATDGCPAPGAVHCGQCGRPACPEHAARLPRPGGPPSVRCGSCLPPVTAALLDAARRADEPAAAEEPLTRWAPASAVARRTAALLRAERGDPAGGAQAYGDAGDDPAARAALAGIRFALAVGAVAEERYDEAGSELDLILELTPAHPVGLRGKQLLAERRADLDEREGRHRQAFEHRRASWQQAPGDPAAIHALALAAHRLAASGAGRAYWEWTAACWAAVLHSAAFWELLAERTGRPQGPDRVAAARAALADQVGRDLRESEAAAAAEAEAEAAAAAETAGAGLDVRWSLELKAAEEMARVALPADGRPALSCGPLLLARIREQSVGPAWTKALDTALASGRRSTGLTRLAALLSPLGVQHVLLEQGLYEEAASALAGQPGEEAAALLAEVLTRQARELHQHREWTAALDCFTRAAAAGAGLDALHEEIADSALRGVRDLLAQDSEDHAGAVALLERALALGPGHPAVRENLGASYLQLGRQVNNDRRDYAEATRLVRLALEFVPDDELARRTAGTVLVNHAGELMERGSDADFERAEGLLREAAAVSDADEVRGVLAGVLYRKCRRLAVARDRTGALAAAGQAVLADPEKPQHDVAAVRAEARRMVGVMLHNHALGEEFKRRLGDRAGLLEEARWYEDDEQTREALAWTLRNHGVDRANASDFARAVRLLKQSLDVQDLPDTRAQLALCYRIQAVELANRRDLYGARRAVGEGLEFDPYDPQLLALKMQLARMR